MNGKTVVITGGTQGLGAELAQRLESDGAEVIIIARRKEKFEKMGLKNASFCEVDISDIDQVENFVDQLNGKTIDVLLNVAGIWTDDEIESRKPEQRKSAINTNALGTINITDALLPNLKQSDSAQIVFVVSNSGYLGLGGDTSGDWPSYNASKWAERGYAFALRNKIQESGDSIKIGAIYPGVLQTW